MQCDLCGSNSELFRAEIEKTLMNVCKRCLKFGRQIRTENKFNINNIINKIKSREEEIFILKEDYNILLKLGRERLGLSQEDLAKKLNEKLSLIQKVENKEIKPNDNLIKKLEGFFNIKLTENYREENRTRINLRNQTLTIGDLLRLKNNKK